MTPSSPWLRGKMPYKLGCEVFSSKKAIKERFQGIAKTVGPVTNKEDHAFLVGLLHMHQEAVEKIGPGIKGFEIKINAVFKNAKTPVVHRIDGTSVDFSYRNCLQPKTDLGKFSEACRFAVKDQIFEWKMQHVGGKTDWFCPITNKQHPVSQMEVDHKSPLTFNTIVHDFISRHFIDISAVEYDVSGNKNGNHFADEFLRNSWIRFHDRYATLWLISKEGHKQITNQRRVR